MFENILKHENISLMLGTDCAEHVSLDDGQIYFDGELYNGIFVYTGEVDVLLKCKFGNLPYRTLDFEFENHSVDEFQPCGTVNYTVDMPYTRITEFKHMTLQDCETTTILKEYSLDYIPGGSQIPYYPIINNDSLAVYEKYLAELKKYRNLYLAGRLAEYKYFNMDQVVLNSLNLAEKCLNSLFCGKE